MSEKYYYAVSRTAELENRLLTPDRIERLADATDAAAALRLLSGTVYGDGADRIAGDPSKFEEILTEQTEATFDYIREVSPDPKLADMYLITYDIANLKVLFKGELLGGDYSHLLSALGIHGRDRLTQAFSENDFRTYPEKLGKAVTDIRAKLDAGAFVGIMEYELDKTQFAIRLDYAKSLSPFLVKYIRILADLANIEDFLRVRKGGKGAFYPVWIDGGFLTQDFFDPYFGEGLNGLENGLAQTDYTALCPGVGEYAASGSLTLLEKLSADFATAWLRTSRMASFGPEKLAGYIAARMTEISALRIIFVGKVNSIPPAVIKQRLRELY